MRIRRRDRPDAEEAERLLRGLDGAAVNGDPLAGLLAAAAAPAWPDELAGEDAALAAYRAARVEPEHFPAVRVRRPWRRTAGIVWIAVAAATATAGVAVAATTHARNQPARPRPPVVPNPTRHAPDASETGTTRPYPPSPSVTAPKGTGPAGESEFAGLCRSYLLKDRTERGKSLQTPAFRTLVTVAGGPERVDAYCRQVVTPRPEPSRSTADDGRESAAPQTSPAIKPDVKDPAEPAVKGPAKTVRSAAAQSPDPVPDLVSR